MIIPKIKTLLILPEQFCYKLVRVFHTIRFNIEKLPTFKPVSNKFNFLSMEKILMKFLLKESEEAELFLVEWWNFIGSVGEVEHQ